MKKAILFGLGTLAELVLHSNSFHKDPYDIVALTADPEFINIDALNGIPVIPFKKVREVFPPESSVGFIICVGYKNMNQDRERISERIVQGGYKILNFIDEQAIIRTHDIGTGNIFLEGCNIGAGSKIGNGNIFYPHSLLAHHCIVGNYNYFAISSSIGGFTRISDCCFIGNNATIRDKCNIASYTLVGGGAYVNANTSAYDVVVPERSHVLENKSSLQMNL